MHIKSSVKKVFSLVATCVALTSLGAGLFAESALAAPTAALEMKNATAKYTAKDYQGALNLFKAVVVKEPTNALAHYYLALCNQCLARVGEAKGEYKWVSEHSSGALAEQAKTGLAQLDKVNVRTGGDSAGSSMPATATASASTKSDGKDAGPSKDLIERSGAKDKDATASGAAAATKGAPAAKADKVSRIVNFYSENSRQSQTMEENWSEIKTKFTKYACQKVNAGDEMCTTYGVTEFPTILILDKAGHVLSTQSGVVTADQVATAVDSANKK
jgi:hypothetical protein